MASGTDQLSPLEIGGGHVDRGQPTILRLPANRQSYADAQLDDYQGLRRSDFPWRPPLEMSLRARASVARPLGTLGFGFWNDPFSLTIGGGGAARRLPAPPQALWFFYGSQPNDMAFPGGERGAGWKASCLRSMELPTWLLAAPALAAYLLSHVPWLRGPVMRTALQQIRAQEQALELDLTTWHSYRLAWRAAAAAFYVDGEQVLQAEHPHPGPLGFVAWIDNQYAVISPERGLRFGVLNTEVEQRLELDDLLIAPLSE